MVDSFTLQKRIKMHSPNRMVELGFRKRRGAWDANGWYKNPARGGPYCPSLTWSQTLSGDWLHVQASAPRIIYGRNTVFPTQSDVESAVERVGSFVEETADIEFDANNARVTKVEYFANLPVDRSNLNSYLDAIFDAALPKFRRSRIDGSVMFASGSKIFKFYDKQVEALAKKLGTDAAEEAADVLRYEIRIPTTTACKRLMNKYGLCSRYARDVLVGPVALAELSQGLADLGLDRPIGTYDSRIDRLRDYYGDSALFRRLVAFLTLFDRYSEGFWRFKCGGYSRSLYFEHMRLIKKAGAWLRAPSPLGRLVIPESLFSAVKGVESTHE